MTNRGWRTVAAILAVVAALLGGATLAALLVPGSPKASSAAGSQIAGGSGTPGASSSAGSSSSAAPSTSADVSPSASASPTAPPAPKATITFLGLKVDAADDAAGHARSITFTSSGAGPVDVKLTAQTPQGLAHLCVIAGTETLGCRNWASGTFKARALSGKVNWKITVRGVGIATPVVNLALTFPAVKPKVTVHHARFDGTAFEDYNGVQARFTPRAKGKANVTASWGGHNFVYELDLVNETSGTGTTNLPGQGPAPETNQTLSVTAAEKWRLVLKNAETGFGRTDLTVAIAWP